MKARKFQVIIEINFDKVIDEDDVPGRILQAMRHDAMPPGMCTVYSRPVVETLDERYVRPRGNDLPN